MRPPRVRGRPKGRSVEPRALAEVRELLGAAPRRRDLLIEHLHRLQDARGHLPSAQLVALAQEMGLAPAEVFEVATFYHHFDVVRDGETPPPPLTVRVCESVSCAIAGAKSLRQALAAGVGSEVRIIAAPCVGRCEQAPVAVVGRHPIGRSTVETVRAAIEARAIDEPVPPYTDYAAYRASGGYRLLRDLHDGKRSRDEVIAALEHSNLRGLGGAGFPAGRKWRIVAAEPAPRRRCRAGRSARAARSSASSRSRIARPAAYSSRR